MRLHIFLVASALVAGCYDPGDLGDTPYRCSKTFPECPSGYQCCIDENCSKYNPASLNSKFNNMCVRESVYTGGASTSLQFPAKGGVYMGNREPSGLSPNCAADGFEPNDTLGQASKVAPLESGTLDKLTVCPGPPPDVDIYPVNLSGEYFQAKITFAVKNGDLDMALFNDQGSAVISDLNEKNDNACISTDAKLTGTFFVAVWGAKNIDGGIDANRYALTPKKSAMTKQSCTAAMPDLSMSPDLTFE